MQWSTQALEVYLWWPYNPPIGTEPTDRAPTPKPGLPAVTSNKQGEIMRIPDITANLDNLANEIQEENPIVAYAIDRISDSLERIAVAPRWMEKIKEILKKNDIPEEKQNKIVEEIMVSTPGRGWMPARNIPLTQPSAS